jgi:hypothetical protein
MRHAATTGVRADSGPESRPRGRTNPSAGTAWPRGDAGGRKPPLEPDAADAALRGSGRMSDAQHSRNHVVCKQAIVPSSAAAMIVRVTGSSRRSPSAIVVRPSARAPTTFSTAESRTARRGRSAGRDRRPDGVRGVVEPVREVERECGGDDEDEQVVNPIGRRVPHSAVPNPVSPDRYRPPRLRRVWRAPVLARPSS